jgi:hypothetical protein
MMTKTLPRSRFGSPTVLGQDTRVLGATAGEWDAALTGNMEKSLEEVRRAAASNTPKRDPAFATSFDVASAARKYLFPG